MSISFPSPKDPDEVLDYTIDWTARIASGDSISTFTVTGNGVNIDSSSLDGSIITVWLSGGNTGVDTSVHCRVDTLGGRTMDQTVKLKILNK